MSKFNQKPFLISGYSKAEIGSNTYGLYLDINNKSRLEGMYFECSKEDPLFILFDDLANLLERRPISEISTIVSQWKSSHKDSFEDQFINLPEYLLEQAISDYSGTNQSLETLSSRNSGRLICRCFGVSESQIKEVINKSNEAGILDVADKLRATIGCGTCRKDVEQLILTTKNEKLSSISENSLNLKFDSNGERIRPMGLSPAEFVLKIDSLKSSWMREQELINYKIEIDSISGHTLYLKVTPNDNAQYILDTFKEYVEDKLKLTLCFNRLI